MEGRGKVDIGRKRGKSCESSEAEGRDKNIVYDKYKLPIERFLKINSATM